MEVNYFTIVQWFLSYIAMNQPWVHMYTYIPSLLNLPPVSLPISPLQADTEPLFQFPEPHSKFPLAIYFTYGIVSILVTLSIRLTFSSLSPCPYFLCLFLHCCPVNEFFSTIFLDSIYIYVQI